MTKSYWMGIGLVLLITLARWDSVSADGPGDGPDQDRGRRVGLTSTTVECLAVEAGTLDSVSAKVRLEWQGQVDEALLVLAAAGSQGGHSIYINGRLVASAPLQPGGGPCQDDFPVEIPIPSDVLVQGENVILLTNDADISDDWTAADLYLEIHGVLSLPHETLVGQAPPALPPPEIGAMAVVTSSQVLISSYDGTLHTVWYQVPNGYTGVNPVPLVIGLHGWGGTGEDVINSMGTAVNQRGWLFAAPNMHGNFYIDGKRALAWPGAQHDIIDTVEFMESYYNVDASRIYVTGGSMGGQTTAVTAAKYPDVFAAAVEWKGFTDLTDWYSDLAGLSKGGLLRQMRREVDPSCDPVSDPVCGTPPAEPFEYQRRSALEMPQNSRLIPLKMWHDVQDQLVPIYHSRDLRDALNSWNPPTPATLIEVDTGNQCTQPPYNDPDKHCYTPDYNQVLNFLAGFTLSSQAPLSLTIRTDESKPYYWLNVAQTGGDHWSEVYATYDLAGNTVTALISDTRPLTLAFNLGSTPITGTAGIAQPGMGLPATTYLVKGGGNFKLANYTSGYLTVTLTTTGQFTLTISPATVVYVPIVVKN